MFTKTKRSRKVTLCVYDLYVNEFLMLSAKYGKPAKLQLLLLWTHQRSVQPKNKQLS